MTFLYYLYRNAICQMLFLAGQQGRTVTSYCKGAARQNPSRRNFRPAGGADRENRNPQAEACATCHGLLGPVGAVEGAILDGLAEMARLQIFRSVQVGDRARDFEDAVVGAGG